MTKMGPYVSLGILVASVLGAAPATAEDAPSASDSAAARPAAEWRPMHIRFQRNTDYCLGVAATEQPQAGSRLKLLPCLYEYAHVDLAYDSSSGRVRLLANSELCVGRSSSSAVSGELIATSCAAADAVAVDFKSETISLRGSKPVCVDKDAVARPCVQEDADLKWNVVDDAARQAQEGAVAPKPVARR